MPPRPFLSPFRRAEIFEEFTTAGNTPANFLPAGGPVLVPTLNPVTYGVGLLAGPLIGGIGDLLGLFGAPEVAPTEVFRGTTGEDPIADYFTMRRTAAERSGVPFDMEAELERIRRNPELLARVGLAQEIARRPIGKAAAVRGGRTIFGGLTGTSGLVTRILQRLAARRGSPVAPLPGDPLPIQANPGLTLTPCPGGPQWLAPGQDCTPPIGAGDDNMTLVMPGGGFNLGSGLVAGGGDGGIDLGSIFGGGASGASTLSTLIAGLTQPRGDNRGFDITETLGGALPALLARIFGGGGGGGGGGGNQLLEGPAAGLGDTVLDVFQGMIEAGLIDEALNYLGRQFGGGPQTIPTPTPVGGGGAVACVSPGSLDSASCFYTGGGANRPQVRRQNEVQRVNPVTGKIDTWLYAGRPTGWSRVNVKKRRRYPAHTHRRLHRHPC